MTTGAVHWIDHYVTSTNDVERWIAFHERVVGARVWPDFRRERGMFMDLARCRIGAFVSQRPLPPTLGLGAGLPRYGLYVHASDIDAHLRRLEAAGAVHGPPARTAAEGEAGISLPWQDPDGNQFEFWAPDRMPDGAMADCGPERVGRISHGVFESRDIQRTATFFARYCALERERGGAIAHDTLVLRLAAGGRLVFRTVTELGGRTTGCGLPDAHTALLLHTDDFIANYERLWSDMPEAERPDDAPIANPGALGPRTVVHPTRGGKRFKKLTGRGDDFFDWDTNMFHFYGGVPIGDSLAVYDGRSVEFYAQEWERTRAVAH